MVRHHKRRTTSKYSEADMQKALEAIQNKNLKPCDLADMSEQLPIYDHGCSSILVSQLPEIQNFSSISLVIGNAIQTLYSEQVENLSNVAYDAVPDQCNWNDTGIKLFENNENLYDPFNPSIELVHQPHASSRLNQSSTTISDRSANITTDNSRNSCFEVVTNVISNFLTPSFLSPMGENQKHLSNPRLRHSTSKRLSSDTNANIMPMISCHSNVPYIPPQMPYSTQIHAPYGYNQSLNDFYSYAQSPITCCHCNQEILNGSYAKCTTCIKCSLQSYLDLTVKFEINATFISFNEKKSSKE
ncbi:unnamed protein product [Rotaria socialis]|uniref:Uncharacterized protein n=2 Tax=Rotaria socialis TaxID=392032 RepID=A0A820XE07_9BILA|nr:unnamed protein product [Rotaria socialis]